MSVLLGDGDGTFRSPVSYAVAGADGVSSLAVGDFNGDGRADLAARYEIADPTTGDLHRRRACRCCWATATGRSGARSTTRPRETESPSLAVGDFNGDGRLDLAAGTAGGRCCWATATGPSRPGQLRDRWLTASPSLAVGDFNGDGRLDLAAGYDTSDPYTGYSTGGVSVLLGNGDGTFQSPVSYPAARDDVTSLAVGDFNGDGRADIAAGYENIDPTTFTSSGGVSVLPGDGDGTFRRPIDDPVAGGAPSLAVGDFNGDGRLDIAAGYRDLRPATDAHRRRRVGAAGRRRRDVPEPRQLRDRGRRHLPGGGRLQRRRPARHRRRLCELRRPHDG